ncbi:hypothetical protein B0H11DRAFT_1905078 [Mycena galericulata]|nr:hypothetical protein B0H11DRAFT_1905078 [Mycena galericulata]
MVAQDTSRLASPMDRAFERDLSKQLKQSPNTWHVEASICVPYCSPKCTVCKTYLSHVTSAKAGRDDDEGEDEDEEEDEVGTTDESDTENGSDVSSGSASDSDSESDIGRSDDEDQDLVKHMAHLFNLQSINGRLRTNHLFQTDPAALGRAQEPIADLLKRISVLKADQDKVEAEVAELQRQLQTIQEESHQLRRDLEHSNDGPSRKRSNVVHSGEFPDDPMTGLGQPQLICSTTWLTLPPLPLADESALILQVHQFLNLTAKGSRGGLHPPQVFQPPNRHEKSPIVTPEQFAERVRSRDHHPVKGIPVCGPERNVDLRDVRGHLALMTLAPLGRTSRHKSTRDRYKSCFLSILRILAIPGAYAERIRHISAPIAPVALSHCKFGSNLDKLDDNTVVRQLADHGLTMILANDCWQYSYKFIEEDMKSHRGHYDKKTLANLLARAKEVLAVAGKPSGIRSESEDRYPVADQSLQGWCSSAKILAEVHGVLDQCLKQSGVAEDPDEFVSVR